MTRGFEIMNYKLVGIGEVLWDLLPGGRQLGGAPGNFASHARSLGASVVLASRVGDDALGREAIGRLAQLGIPPVAIEVDASRPTGTVGVELSADGQPRFDIHRGVAWDAIEGNAAARDAVAVADAVCFGTLAQRSAPSRAAIRALVASSPSQALRILDVNLRQDYYSDEILRESLALANVLKLNDAELPRLAELLSLPGDERAQLQALSTRHRLRLIAYTRGSRGSLLFADGRWSEHPGITAHVVDTIGAGDSFTAAMAVGFLSGWDLDRINAQANRVAAYVCSCPGATPDLPAELRGEFSACPNCRG